MKKTNSKTSLISVVFLVLLAFFLFLFFYVLPIETRTETPIANEIVSITNLDIKTKASLDNTYKVTETFSIKFNSSGLSEVVRYIPYAGYTYRSDGKSTNRSFYVARILNASGHGEKGEEFNLYPDEESGYLTFGLKNSKGYFTRGETRRYEITYTYDCGQDANSGFDDLYFNIVGTASQMSIQNVTFEVKLPKIKAESISVYYGQEGSTATLAHHFDDENFVVSGQIEKLLPFEGITLRAVYKEGTFNTKPNFSVFALVALCVSLFAFALAIAYYFCSAQNRKLAVPVEVSVPEGLTPYRADFFVSNTCDSRNLISTLLVLANKGYVSINKLKDDDIEISRLKEINSSEDAALKSVYNLFFDGKDKRRLSEFDKMDVVEAQKFALTAQSIGASETQKSQQTLYKENPRKFQKTLKILAIICLIFIVASVFFSIMTFFGFLSQVYLFKVVFLAIAAVFFILAVLLDFHWIVKTLIYAAMLAFILGLYGMFAFNFVDGYYLFVFALALELPTFLLSAKESKYKKEGAVAKGRALGFKNFIEKCEVNQIKMFAEENPNYFFDVLPYAYSFGLSDVWIKKFENIPLTMPVWLSCENSSLSDLVFISFVLNTFETKTSSISSKILPTNHTNFGGFSGGGHFGGGGFSGGGHGGGGFGAR